MNPVEAIIVQPQMTNDCCVSTCVAMLLEIPQQYIVETYNARYHARECNLGYILDGYGVEYKADFRVIDATSIADIDFNCIAFLTVPSLNYPGGHHQILAEWDSEDMLWRIYDPQKGTGYKYYEGATREEDPNCYPMKSYAIDCVVSMEELDRIRQAYGTRRIKND